MYAETRALSDVIASPEYAPTKPTKAPLFRGAEAADKPYPDADRIDETQ
jgi:hypothetical protein